MSKYYKIIPKKLGAEVVGIDLQTENRPEVIEEIKKDVTNHRLLFFTNQGVISGQRHVEISKWFGELESTFYKHHKSPHPDVFRVSNDESEGCTGVGRTGWHIDGSFQPAPFAYSLYHMVSVPKTGATAFVPLTELIERLDPETYSRWNRLWMLSDRRSGPAHPMIYKHPITKKPVLCLHLGMTERFLWDYKSPDERITDPSESRALLEEIHEQIVKKNSDLIYRHEWQPGEFVMSDNLAVGHEAVPETQLSRKDVGLRVLHRTTIKGVHKPTK
ncbi:hypothetical protein V9T40_010301 [Parthenolecanium corni]|uniref:TauD/TfdA-like domain-containing protein n=1 Tax=Parthenolecanium corni TaxID=536013 RepID=A0AAN9Y041_9HEMI